MRRKLTEPADLPNAEDLPDLTAQQQEFVRRVLEGMSAADAYRTSYDCSASKDTTVWTEASKLRNNPKVALWLAAARKACMGSAKISREEHIRRMDRLEQLCEESGNLGAAVQAEINIGKASGHYVEKFEDVTREEPADTLEQIRKHSPELAAILAAKHGLKLDASTDDRPDRLN